MAAWDHCLLALPDNISEGQQRLLLEKQLRKAKALAPLFANIDGTEEGSEQCTLRYVLNAHAEVNRRRKDAVQEDLMKSVKTSTAAPAPNAKAATRPQQ